MLKQTLISMFSLTRRQMKDFVELDVISILDYANVDEPIHFSILLIFFNAMTHSHGKFGSIIVFMS